jgi:cytochrome P450
MAAAIPTLADPPSRQWVQAIVDPLGYYRRCFRAHNGVVRVHMVPGLSPQQVLINDPAVLQELMGRDNGRGISAPGHLNDLMEQVVGQHSLMLLEPAPHRARRRLLTPPFHGERARAASPRPHSWLRPSPAAPAAGLHPRAVEAGVAAGASGLRRGPTSPFRSPPAHPAPPAG